MLQTGSSKTKEKKKPYKNQTSNQKPPLLPNPWTSPPSSTQYPPFPCTSQSPPSCKLFLLEPPLLLKTHRSSTKTPRQTPADASFPPEQQPLTSIDQQPNRKL
ncbi:hypothetical protein M758_UG138100 [Ceratodon purpureus]|nr:hypothetical protein M758_UG138100 [Ceratodon purpureus]